MGIVGEIYVVMESGVNMRIEEILGGSDVKFEIYYLSQWIDDNVMPNFANHGKRNVQKGEIYTDTNRRTHKRNNGTYCGVCDQFDRIVHLMPFGCLPE